MATSPQAKIDRAEVRKRSSTCTPSRASNTTPAALQSEPVHVRGTPDRHHPVIDHQGPLAGRHYIVHRQCTVLPALDTPDFLR